nr:uncharacterized protein LOC107383460 isoform X1 [Nothobranchius furzeri]
MKSSYGAQAAQQEQQSSRTQLVSTAFNDQEEKEEAVIKKHHQLPDATFSWFILSAADMVTGSSRHSDDLCSIMHGSMSYKICINKLWHSNFKPARSLCHELFSKRPKLCVIAITSGSPASSRKSAQENTSSSEQRGAQTGKVLCDVCNRKALKSCLVCLSSYCKTHLEPHVKIPGLMRHKLTSPVKNLEGQMWNKYEKATRRLEIFRRYFAKLMRCVRSS